MNSRDIQRAVYEELTGSPLITTLVTGVFDEVPQGQKYPYIVIGEDTAREWDTDDILGVEATLTLHAWSRKAGRQEVKRIMDTIYVVLHRADIAIQGMNTVLCMWEFGETFLDPDGITRHGVARYRLIAQEA